MKIGILGGTFNPIHKAHMQMARIARDELKLDLVLLMVAADPPHKDVEGHVAAEKRLMMARLAAQDVDGVEASDLEINRPGKSYTADTLEEVSRLYPGAELVLILGSDMLADLPTWYEPERILQRASLACVPRRGCDETDRASVCTLKERFGVETRMLPGLAEELSSTQVRRRFYEGRPVEGMLCPLVETWCYETGLYFPPEIQGMQAKCRAAASPKRYRHIMGCVKAAASLSEKWGVDRERARIAALLHDCAKGMPLGMLRVLSGDDMEIAPVMHAFAGAVVAKMEYHVTDEAILRAIRLHCTGEANMQPLEELVYLADLTEPGRSFPGVEEMRRALERGPEEAMLAALLRSKAYVAEQKGRFHPASERALLYYQASKEVSN